MTTKPTCNPYKTNGTTVRLRITPSTPTRPTTAQAATTLLIQTILPKAATIRIIEKAGALRVADAAGDVLIEVLEEYGKKIAQKAIIYAEHAKRRTVKASDVKLAAKDL